MGVSGQVCLVHWLGLSVFRACEEGVHRVLFGFYRTLGVSNRLYRVLKTWCGGDGSVVGCWCGCSGLLESCGGLGCEKTSPRIPKRFRV